MKIKYLLFIISFLISSSTYAGTSRYRIMLGENPSYSMVIGWDQLSGENPIIYYGEVDHGRNYTSYTHSKKYDSQIYFREMYNTFVTLNNLKPNTTYYFVIKDSEGIGNRYSFQTIPDDINAQLSIIGGGDSRNSTSVRIKANSLVAKLNPHAVIFDGDMTGGDSSSEWKRWFDHWQHTINSNGKMTPIIPARGNHEQPETISKLFNLPSKQEYYSLSLSNLLTIYTLNSETSIAGNQTDWLKEELIRHRHRTVHQMAQYHRPMRPHAEGKSDQNELYFNWSQLFYDYGVKLVLEGDSHTSKTTFPVKPSYEEGSDEGFIIENQKGTTYIGEGCWGAPLRNARDIKSWTKNAGEFNQFKLLWINKDRIEIRTIKIDSSFLSHSLSDINRYNLPSSIDVFEGHTNPTIIKPYHKNSHDNTSNSYEKIIAKSITSHYADAEETIRNGNLDIGSDDLDMNGEKMIGFIFEDIPLPNNITITDAYIQFTAKESNSEPTIMTIKGLTDTHLTRFINSYAISKQPTTTNSTTWSPEAWTKDYFLYKTSNLSSIINELVQKPEWKPGNNLGFKISGSGVRSAKSYNGNTSPQLIIKYKENTPNSFGKHSINIRISRDEDDAFEYDYNGYVNHWEHTLYMPNNGSTKLHTGLVFAKSGIKKGAKIKRAFLEFYTTSNSDRNANITIHGIKEANTTSFTRDYYNITSRAVTTEMVQWTLQNWRDRNFYQSVDISSIVQEIIDQDEWQEINNIGFILTGFGTRYAHSFDHPSNLAPKLVIEYDLPNESISSQNIVISKTKITDYNNDIEENAYGSIDTGSRELDLSIRNDQTEPQLTGLIFNTTIPKNAHIIESYIQFTSQKAAHDTTYLQIRGIKEPGNLYQFNGSFKELSNKKLTQNYQDWTPQEWFQKDETSEKQRTPDLTSIIQEVIDDPYWKTGYGIGFSIFGNGKRPVHSRNHSIEYAPELVVKYVINDDFPITQPPTTPTDLYPITRTIKIPIAQSYDDAEEFYHGGIDLHSYDLDIAKDYREGHLIGLIFKKLPIPRNATINEAYLQFTSDHDETTEEISNFKIQAISSPEKYINLSRFYGHYKELSLMPLTQSFTPWTPNPWLIKNETGNNQKTTDLSNTINEAISNTYWLKNNSLAFIISGSGKRDAKSFENVYLKDNEIIHENGDYRRTPAVLSITYTYMSNEPTTVNRSNYRPKDIVTNNPKINSKSTISIYPNPTSDYVYIQSNKEIKQITLFDIHGKKLMQLKPLSSDRKISLKHLKEGIYYIVITDYKNQHIKKKIIKKNM